MRCKSIDIYANARIVMSREHCVQIMCTCALLGVHMWVCAFNVYTVMCSHSFSIGELFQVDFGFAVEGCFQCFSPPALFASLRHKASFVHGIMHDPRELVARISSSYCVALGRPSGVYCANRISSERGTVRPSGLQRAGGRRHSGLRANFCKDLGACALR